MAEVKITLTFDTETQGLKVDLDNCKTWDMAGAVIEIAKGFAAFQCNAQRMQAMAKAQMEQAQAEAVRRSLSR